MITTSWLVIAFLLIVTVGVTLLLDNLYRHWVNAPKEGYPYFWSCSVSDCTYRTAVKTKKGMQEISEEHMLQHLKEG